MRSIKRAKAVPEATDVAHSAPHAVAGTVQVSSQRISILFSRQILLFFRVFQIEDDTESDGDATESDTPQTADPTPVNDDEPLDDAAVVEAAQVSFHLIFILICPLMRQCSQATWKCFGLSDAALQIADQLKMGAEACDADKQKAEVAKTKSPSATTWERQIRDEIFAVRSELQQVRFTCKVVDLLFSLNKRKLASLPLVKESYSLRAASS